MVSTLERQCTMDHHSYWEAMVEPAPASDPMPCFDYDSADRSAWDNWMEDQLQDLQYAPVELM